MASFKEGILEEYSETPYAGTATGTTVTFIPDPKVFKNMTEGYSYKRICDEIKNISYLNKGVHFFVENSDGTKSEFYSENGIGDFITDHSTNALMKAPIISTKSDKIDSVEIAFMWTNSKEEKSYVFVNGLYCSQGGSPITGAKTALSTKMKSFCGTKIEPELIRKGLVYVINCKVNEPSFTNQTKQTITNPNLRTLANEAFKEGLEEFSHTPEFSTIIELIKRYQTAEKAADRERQKILNMGKEIEKETQKKSMLMGKLKDCRKHDESSSLYIVEGDSALGPFVSCRDSTHVAAMPIRGKIINALKHPLDEVLDNEEVKAISKVCGCGILDKVNLSKFRYGKVCFAADSDPDGYAIVCLLLVLFYVLMPDLIRAGKVYWAKFPLYEVTIGKKTHLVYDDEELAAILKEHPRAAVERNKGLGEISTEAFGEAAFGENARLVRFTMEDVAAARDMLEMLLGNENKKRTEYIFSHVDFKVVEGE